MCASEDWVLALSNQALCHLRLGEHAEAVEAADRCLLEEGAPVKVHFTKFKAIGRHRNDAGKTSVAHCTGEGHS